MHGEQILTKVVAIAGDIEIINLGLSKEDRKMLTEELEIIYHSAATIRFDEPLKKAILCNTRGTKLLLNLARECKNLLVINFSKTKFETNTCLTFRHLFTCLQLFVAHKKRLYMKNPIQHQRIQI